MSKILVFGAGGRAGGAAVEEALRRGHEVTAAVRTPSKYAAAHATATTSARATATTSSPTATTSTPAPKVVAADVTAPEAVARLAAEHDAVIAAVYDPAPDFFPRAGQALADNIGTTRLIWVGLASILATDNGTLLMDSPGYPTEYRAFFEAHREVTNRLAASQADWVSITPSGDFDHEHPERTGSYRFAPGDATSRISYADLAIALLDEIDEPRHRGVLLGVRRS
ncbi:NAD(P)-dependent oxidoreductase [Kribbella sp. DT2]|uniref:NAD(P)-dependent oxidoreductase n=1 Tax=Kribbella sp. DT2 TaxID=3393427 RepID=UPI003CEBB569